MILEFLIDNPLVLLFVVTGVGYPLGRVRIRGASLGVAVVLFTGLAAGALHSDITLPEILPSLGLVLFVYAIGAVESRAAPEGRGGARSILMLPLA